MNAYQPVDIARMIGGDLHGGSQGAITGVSIDSRRTQKGDLFVAISTDANDGHRYVPAAFAKGAHAALVSREKARAHLRDWDIFTLIAVDDPVEALQKWAHAHRKTFDGPVIAITGSNGKTTTKEFTAAALSPLGPVLKTEGTLNNHLGVPITLLELDRRHRAGIIEIGMNHAGEVLQLGRLSEPEIGIITNTGQAHLEYFPTLDSLIDAKWELVETLTGARRLILNRDDKGLRARASDFDGTIIWFALEEDADWKPERMERNEDGCWSFTVRNTDVALSVPGKHMVENALAALAAADALGVPIADAAREIASARSEIGRMRSYLVSGIAILDDAYNANPSSMKAALQTLAEMDGQRYAVLGGMRELGAESVRLHNEVGAEAARLGITVVGVGELGRHIADGARVTDGNAAVDLLDHESAAAWLNGRLNSGDTVLVKGSRSEQMERVIAALQDIRHEEGK